MEFRNEHNSPSPPSSSSSSSNRQGGTLQNVPPNSNSSSWPADTMSSASHGPTLRHDRQQPIIIQNFELLTAGQLKFKRKSLSTANLFLSSAALSRQAAWFKEPSRPGSGLSVDTSSFAHQACDFANRSQIESIMKYSQSDAGEDKRSSNVKKHVNFAEESVMPPFTLCSQEKLWYTGNSFDNNAPKATPHNDTSAFNKNEDDKNHIKKDEKNSSLTIGQLASFNLYGADHRVSSEKQNCVLFSSDLPLSEVTGWQFLNNDTSGSDRSSQPAKTLVDVGQFEQNKQVSKDIVDKNSRGRQEKVITKEENESSTTNDARVISLSAVADIAMSNSIDAHNDESQDYGLFKGDDITSKRGHVNEDCPGHVTTISKSKKVSFLLTDKEENVSSKDCLWIDVERSQNSKALSSLPENNRSGSSLHQTSNTSNYLGRSTNSLHKRQGIIVDTSTPNNVQYRSSETIKPLHFATPKSQAEINSEYLMRIYSDDPRVRSGIHTVPHVNEELSYSVTSRESPHIKTDREKLTQKHPVLVAQDSRNFSSRGRGRERRLVSTSKPLGGGPRSLECSTRFRSASARERGLNRLDQLDSVLRFTDAKVFERTALNKRLEELVINSVQLSRSKPGLHKYRSSLLHRNV